MFDRLLNAWEGLRTSLWPVPVGMLLVALLLREAVSLADAMVADEEATGIWWLHSGSGDDARNLLSTLVAALITMASVMFSITMVVLSLASNQFGSRLVRTYVSDYRTQGALGIFVMTIVYCLLVLRTVEKDMPAADVPHVSVTVGLLMALACVLVLLLFLHVVARSVVADTVVRRVAQELEGSIERMLPVLDGQPPEPPAGEVLPEDLMDRAAIVRSHKEGYVQSIEYGDLVDLASRHGILVRLQFRAGVFMCRDGWLALAYPGDAVTDEVADRIRGCVAIGKGRTPTQDVEFSIRHLVDIALRALSPGINDPNTALAVIDHLRGALAQLMSKRLPTAIYRDGEGVVRAVSEYTGFNGIFDAAFHQIRQAGAGQPAVVIHLLRALARLAEHLHNREQHDGLLRHAHMAARAGLARIEEPRDRADIQRALENTEAKLRACAAAIRPDTALGSGASPRGGRAAAAASRV